MRVSAVSEARPGHENEDFLGVAGGLVVVLDGCGVPDSIAHQVHRGCRHGVPWYVRSLGGELLRSAVHPGTPLVDALAEAIGAVTAAHAGSCDLTNLDTPACTVSMVRLDGDRLDYLVLSDSCVLLDARPGGDVEVVCDDRIARAMPPRDGTPLDSPSRAERDRRGSATRAALLNRPDGFWIASTDPAAASQALTGVRPVADLSQVIVATDGGVRLHEFGELDWPALCDTVADEGPSAVVTRTRAAEAADPLATRWPRGKQYDDATIARCALSAAY